MDAGAQAVPAFTPSVIANGGCVYAFQIRAVDVTGDGFVDVLAGTYPSSSCDIPHITFALAYLWFPLGIPE